MEMDYIGINFNENIAYIENYIEVFKSNILAITKAKVKQYNEFKSHPSPFNLHEKILEYMNQLKYK